MIRLSLAALAALAVATPAMAGPGTTASVAVLMGVDLGSAAGAATMAGRIDRAAMDVCGASRGSSREMQLAVRRSDCYRETLTNALSSLNAPAVSAALKDRALPAGDH